MPKITPIHWRKLAKVFKLDDWILSRTAGDHLIYVKKNFSRPVVIPKDSSVEVFVIINNLRTAQISRERYFSLLKKKK